MDWLPETLRVTIFKVKPSPGSPGVWENTVGDAPEVVVSRGKTGIVQEEGPFRDGTLIAKQDPIRVDWLYKARGGEDLALAPAGSLKDDLKQFLPIVEKYLGSGCLPTNRLAFGAVLLFPVDGRPTGYRLIQKLVPGLPVDAEHSTDLNFQTNIPTKSSVVEGLDLNRLRSYSVSRVTLSSITPEMDLVGPFAESFACRLVLDFNTDPMARAELQRDKVIALLGELVHLTSGYLDVP